MERCRKSGVVHHSSIPPSHCLRRNRPIKPLDLAKKARDILLAKKGEQVIVLDVSQLSNVTDFFVIATGANTPHVRALADEVERVLKEAGVRCYRRAGTFESGWVVVDYLDMVIHVFSARAREYYALEKLWSDAPVVEG